VTQHFSSSLRESKPLFNKRKKAAHNIFVVGGGPDIAQQFIRSGLLNEIQIHLVRIMMGAGIRIFENLDPMKMKMERVNIRSPNCRVRSCTQGPAVNPKSQIVWQFR
jgi:dihydrofolate reductase